MAEEEGGEGVNVSTVEEMSAGYDFRDQLIQKADGYIGTAPYWHGWAIMDAFLAGIEWQQQKREGESDEPCPPSG